MRIFLHSASSSVRQTLAAIVQAAGHTLAHNADDAELTLSDSLHPAAATLPAGFVLTLAANASSEDKLACPIRPNILIQRLKGWEKTQGAALANSWALDEEIWCARAQLFSLAFRG